MVRTRILSLRVRRELKIIFASAAEERENVTSPASNVLDNLIDEAYNLDETFT
ncbi:hypothetical protein DSO57_1014876 [Entomophthora muscae]|uniref:Uncharacterized protein n=1 Tax=Entomophthora muscae TaxID=34485 RepID=A0ACC2TSI8_9FUNG|nr:hypothetical protein DSO57_1014876 [Entomophthora muscae]